jgi:hypothetical protein
MSESKQSEVTAGTPSPERLGSPTIRGFLAFNAGVKVGDNPYQEDTDDFWKWMAGWTSAGEEAVKAKLANT